MSFKDALRDNQQRDSLVDDNKAEPPSHHYSALMQSFIGMCNEVLEEFQMKIVNELLSQ